MRTGFKGAGLSAALELGTGDSYLELDQGMEDDCDYTLGIGPGSLLIDRFTVKSVLGSGVASTTYSVVDSSLGSKEVALKVFSPAVTRDENCLERFKEDSLKVQGLSHKNIVQQFEHGHLEREQFFVAMELVRGETVKSFLERKEEKPLRLKQIVHYLHETALALACAHRLGLCHHSLKPGNVFISDEDAVKVSEFALSNLTYGEECFSDPASFLGELPYVSPEQIKGETADTSTDIYLLGILAYELLAGEAPFAAEEPAQVIKRILEDPLPDISSKREGVPEWLREFIAKATNKSPEERYQTIFVVVNLLEAHLEDPSLEEKKEESYKYGSILGKRSECVPEDEGDIFSRIKISPRVLLAVGVFLIVLLLIRHIGMQNRKKIDAFQHKVAQPYLDVAEDVRSQRKNPKETKEGSKTAHETFWEQWRFEE